MDRTLAAAWVGDQTGVSGPQPVVAESVAEVWDHRAAVRGMEMVYEPSDRRFFQARFQPVD